MKTGITYVPAGRIATLLSELGLTAKEQSGFLRLDFAKGRRLYIANTKRVGRIDIAGAELSDTLAKPPHCGIFGAVKQQVRMDGTEQEVVDRVFDVIAEMQALPPIEKPVKVTAVVVITPELPVTSPEVTITPEAVVVEEEVSAS